MTRSLMFLSTLMLAACGAASTPAPATTTPMHVAAYTPPPVDCDADQISALWCQSSAILSRSFFSEEGIRLFHDAAMLNAQQTDNPMTCRMLFGVQNILYIETMQDFGGLTLPPDLHDDFTSIEPTLVSACPDIADRADGQAREELDAYRVDGDIEHLYGITTTLIVHRVATATVCEVADATRTAISNTADDQPRSSRWLTRSLVSLDQLCDSTHGT